MTTMEPKPLTPEQTKGLECALGGAIALVDWLISRHHLNRHNVAEYCAAARTLLEHTDEASDS